MGNYEETRIINGIIRGNESILKHFYRDNFASIQHLVTNNSGNSEDAKDVFQDGLLVMYQKLKTGNTILTCSIRTYFYGICKNIWRNRLRQKLKTSCCGSIELPGGDLLKKMEQKEKELLYRKHFLKLNCKCQRILTMFFEGKSMNEIADITDHKEGYIRKKKFDCKKQLLDGISSDPQFQELMDKAKDSDLRMRKKAG